MTEKIQLHNECRISAKKYLTVYTWTLDDWSLLYETLYKNGIHSDDFDLNGTDGYTCKLSLLPSNHQLLSLTFSDTLNIQAMNVTYSLMNLRSSSCIYSQPIAKTYAYTFSNGSLQKENPLYVVNENKCPNDSVTIVVKILVVKSIATTKSSNQTALNLKTLSQDRENFPSNVLSNLNAKLHSNILSDVTFVLGDSKFLAHKVILAAHSKVFEAMFTSPMKEQQENNFKIVDFEAGVFKKFLNYLYTGEVTDLETVAEEMLAVADYYQVSPLKTICEVHMLENLCEENVVKYVVIADKFSCSALRNEALHLLRKSQTVLEKALVEESSETMTHLKTILSNNSVEN